MVPVWHLSLILVPVTHTRPNAHAALLRLDSIQLSMGRCCVTSSTRHIYARETEPRIQYLLRSSPQPRRWMEDFNTVIPAGNYFINPSLYAIPWFQRWPQNPGDQ
ncbi:hypothetical protein BX600DRAFT_456680 [Xylariales sp. PMI_506]|nr:hypothetical protein BX600DRAFT_456680 [Xylariales sp. PMI_506]